MYIYIYIYIYAHTHTHTRRLLEHAVHLREVLAGDVLRRQPEGGRVGGAREGQRDLFLPVIVRL